MAYHITSDSTVDLTPAHMEAMGVPFVPLLLSLEGQDIEDDMQAETAARLYSAMRQGKVGVTSQATMISYVALWEPMLQNGDDILYVCFSSGISGTINSATLARTQLLEKYPDRKICIIDSLCASAGEGLLLEYAVALKESGMGYEEACKAVEDQKLHTNHWFTVDDLTYLRRGGRVSGASALIASLLSIKPVMHMDDEGHLIVVEKVKGRRTAIRHLFENLCEKIDDVRTTVINISQADCMEDATTLKNMIAEKYPQIPVNIYSVGAVIGSHSGPGTLALFFFGKANTRTP